MAYFKVTVNGAGMEMPVDGWDTPVRGFFCTHIVRADNSQQAAEFAIKAAHDAWSTRRAGMTNPGPFPQLSVESISGSSAAEMRSSNLEGYTFYTREGDD